MRLIRAMRDWFLDPFGTIEARLACESAALAALSQMTGEARLDAELRCIRMGLFPFALTTNPGLTGDEGGE